MKETFLTEIELDGLLDKLREVQDKIEVIKDYLKGKNYMEYEDLVRKIISEVRREVKKEEDKK